MRPPHGIGMEILMSPHSRVLLFCVSLLAAPLLWELARTLAGDLGGALLSLVVVTAAAVYAQMGQPKPPTGARPA